MSSGSIDTKVITRKFRIVFFLVLAAFITIAFNPFKSLQYLSSEYFTLNGVYPWAVLFICIAFLFSKRYDIKDTGISFLFTAGGACTLIVSFFLPSIAPEFGIFRILLAWVGLAFIFFGEAASLPALLLCIYGFTIAFPRLVDTFAGVKYAQATTWIVYNFTRNFITITGSDSSISMVTLSGEKLVVIINAACSGAASMSVFLAVFALMSIDVPLPKRQWLAMLVLGIIGTSAQNLLRLTLLLFTGYYFGPSSVQGGESIAGYIIFPAWYAVFAFMYLRCARSVRNATSD